MKRFDVYYETKDKRIEKKNLSENELDSFIDSIREGEEHLLRVRQVSRDRDEEER